MLERAIEITTTVDTPGELGMPLELVSTVQSGALAGLGCLERFREILNPPDVEHRPILLRPQPGLDQLPRLLADTRAAGTTDPKSGPELTGLTGRSTPCLRGDEDGRYGNRAPFAILRDALDTGLADDRGLWLQWKRPVTTGGT